MRSQNRTFEKKSRVVGWEIDVRRHITDRQTFRPIRFEWKPREVALGKVVVRRNAFRLKNYQPRLLTVLGLDTAYVAHRSLTRELRVAPLGL